MREDIVWPTITSIWAESGRTPLTISVYLYWARRFVRLCETRGLDPIAFLTQAGVQRVFFDRRRANSVSSKCQAPYPAVRALSSALAALGHHVPRWKTTQRAPHPSPVVASFLETRLRQRGVAKGTLVADARIAAAFISYFRARRQHLSSMRAIDVDDFIDSCAARMAAKTVAGSCSTLRAFLRYLQQAGHIHRDMASLVTAPAVRALDRPPRARPWGDIRRILRAIDPRTRTGCRDRALFLLMAAYGMGVGEVLSLTLDDVHWRERIVRVRRPKTGQEIALPLLDPIAEAISVYVRTVRPRHAPTRALFVSTHLPHDRLSGASPVRDRLRRYAAIAQVPAGFLGTHVFRHSFATRQIESEVSPKVVGDILGHSRPSSTSVYARSAIRSLRRVGLPVPR